MITTHTDPYAVFRDGVDRNVRDKAAATKSHHPTEVVVIKALRPYLEREGVTDIEAALDVFRRVEAAMRAFADEHYQIPIGLMEGISRVVRGGEMDGGLNETEYRRRRRERRQP